MNERQPGWIHPGDKCSVSLTSAGQWMSGEVFVCNEAGIGINPKNDPPFFTPWHNVQMVTFPVAGGSQ